MLQGENRRLFFSFSFYPRQRIVCLRDSSCCFFFLFFCPLVPARKGRGDAQTHAAGKAFDLLRALNVFWRTGGEKRGVHGGGNHPPLFFWGGACRRSFFSLVLPRSSFFAAAEAATKTLSLPFFLDFLPRDFLLGALFLSLSLPPLSFSAQNAPPRLPSTPPSNRACPPLDQFLK